MQNTTGLLLKKVNHTFKRITTSSTSYTTKPLNYSYIATAQRPGKRVKPAGFIFPKYGTTSSFGHWGYNISQIGIFTSETHSIDRYREFHFDEQDNPQSSFYGTALISDAELKALIQNKIREEIMSGKAQLAVDLVELRKTKDMVSNAGLTLFKAYRDLRAGRPFAQFVRAMNKDGFRGTLGNKWLEYIYGWAPTVSGAFDTAEILSESLQQGLTSVGRVKARQIRNHSVTDSYKAEEVYEIARATGYYQYTIRDAKLLRLSQLGFTNPLSVAWELLPWSFVLDWFIDVGGYINRMDFALGIGDFYWQYYRTRKQTKLRTYNRIGPYNLNAQKLIVSGFMKTNRRDAPSQLVANTFKGLKPFTNETVRLTSSVALINQLLSRTKRVR